MKLLSKAKSVLLYSAIMMGLVGASPAFAVEALQLTPIKDQVVADVGVVSTWGYELMAVVLGAIIAFGLVLKFGKKAT